MNTRCEPIYFGDESEKITLGNALTELKKLPSGSIGLIFVDPLYNIDRDFNGMVESWNKEAFLTWLFECIDECHRIFKPHGTMYIMNGAESMPYINPKCRQLFTIKGRVVWSYDSSRVQARNYFGSMYGPILVMVKDQKNYTLNHDDILVGTKTGTKRALINYRKNPPQPYNQKEVPSNVWEFPHVHYLMDECKDHPTQEPKALLKRIILASSSPDDKILNPFAGNFTADVAAVELGRESVGIEINAEYVRMGLRGLSIGSYFSEIKLAKVKKRKTKNLSKKSRLTAESGDLSTK